jgi:hypothetical protein
MTIASPEVQAIREQTVREVIRYLTKDARDLERIGRRVLLWEYQLRRKESEEKVISLAQRLGVSQPRVSKALADVQESLLAIKVIASSTALEQ